MKIYPDISELLKAKAAHRRRLASLPFEEKMEMVFRMQERRRWMKAAVQIDEPVAERPQETTAGNDHRK